MPALHLFIPNTALRDAIAEQLTLDGFEPVHEGGDLAAVLGTEDVAVIFDEGVTDKKCLKILRETSVTSNATPNKKRIFLLGEAKSDWGDVPITESFAKPLRLGHLLARLKFYLAASPRLQSAPVTFGPYRFEPQNRQIVSEGGGVIRLTEKETSLLDYLGQSETPVTREELLAAIWGYDARIDTHTLETHIYQLRRKLDPQKTGENWLVNEQGAYRLRREGIAA